jgi:hypothetical protein
MPLAPSRLFWCWLWYLLLVATGVGAAELPWPGVEYAYVRGYLFRGDFPGETDILVDGQINRTVEKIVPVSPKQVTRLTSAFRKEEENEAISMCYEPHHAFIFFDTVGQPVARMNVCFECSFVECNPDPPTGKTWNIAALLPICRSIGLPVRGDKAYEQFEMDGALRVARSIRPWRRFSDVPKAQSNGLEPPKEPWPWHPYSKVKIYAFSEGRSIVHLGRVNPSVTKEVELNEEQRANLWTACGEGPASRTVGDKEISFDFYGAYVYRRKSWGEDSDSVSWKPGIECFRHGLVCFDAADKPIAFVNLSFPSATRRAFPSDWTAGQKWWDVIHLAELFREFGIPVETDY